MAARKKAKRQRNVGTVVAPPAPLPVDLGKRVSLTVKKASGEELVYTLSDGTKLRLKPVIMGIERSVNKYVQSGDPLYQINAGLIVQTIVPKRLKRAVKS